MSAARSAPPPGPVRVLGPAAVDSVYSYLVPLAYYSHPVSGAGAGVAGVVLVVVDEVDDDSLAKYKMAPRRIANTAAGPATSHLRAPGFDTNHQIPTLSKASAIRVRPKRKNR